MQSDPALRVHMDGARFGNAVVSLGCSPAELTWKAGVDVLCFGGTKTGMLACEAVVFFDRSLSEEFAYRCKQAGQLASKMRYLAAQWVGMLQEDALVDPRRTCQRDGKESRIVNFRITEKNTRLNQHPFPGASQRRVRQDAFGCAEGPAKQRMGDL